jgi:hypothetical protein
LVHISKKERENNKKRKVIIQIIITYTFEYPIVSPFGITKKKEKGIQEKERKKEIQLHEIETEIDLKIH